MWYLKRIRTLTLPSPTTKCGRGENKGNSPVNELWEMGNKGNSLHKERDCRFLQDWSANHLSLTGEVGAQRRVRDLSPWRPLRRQASKFLGSALKNSAAP